MKKEPYRPFRECFVNNVKLILIIPTLPGAFRVANFMYRNFNTVVGLPFRVALLRVQTVARLKPCPTSIFTDYFKPGIHQYLSI